MPVEGAGSSAESVFRSIERMKRVLMKLVFSFYFALFQVTGYSMHNNA